MQKFRKVVAVDKNGRNFKTERRPGIQLNVITTNQPGAVWQIDENQNNVRKVWNKFQDKRKPKIGEDVN